MWWAAQGRQHWQVPSTMGRGCPQAPPSPLNPVPSPLMPLPLPVPSLAESSSRYISWISLRFQIARRLFCSLGMRLQHLCPRLLEGQLLPCTDPVHAGTQPTALLKSSCCDEVIAVALHTTSKLIMQQIVPVWAESDHLCCLLQFDSDFFSNFNTAFNSIASGSGNVNSIGSGNQGAFASGSGNQNAFASGTNNAVASAVSGPGNLSIYHTRLTMQLNDNGNLFLHGRAVADS